MPYMCVITFYTTHSALRAENLAKQAGIVSNLIPTPRELGIDCTLSLSCALSDSERVRSILAANGIEIDSINKISNDEDR